MDTATELIEMTPLEEEWIHHCYICSGPFTSKHGAVISIYRVVAAAIQVYNFTNTIASTCSETVVHEYSIHT